MRLDHISYAATHDQLVDVVQRIGSRIGSAFTDGGIHPRFGTRNFTLALKNGHYL
ncbi:MAG: VOC family protein, partial [Actinobacteria bacterium]|nr:VOC family protein [Actinomycetota bacterium]